MIKSTVALAVLAILASDAAAQVVNGRYQAPRSSSSGKRTGVQAKPTTPPASTITPVLVHGAVPVAVRLVPAVVMSDGRILADFGFGLEQVRRACATVQPSGGKVFIGGGQVISQAAPAIQPVPMIQPAPAQPTASQQMLPSMSHRTPSRAAQGSCFTRDASGRVFITR